MAENAIVPGAESLPAELQAQLQAYLERPASEDITGSQPSIPRIKVLHSGAQSFSIGGNGDDGKLVREFQGIVIHSALNRAWWEKPMDERKEGDDAHPQCSSSDGIAPRLDSRALQSKECSSCPRDAFGTATNGSGKACRQFRRMFVLVEGDTIPSVISIPATSLKSWADYCVGTLAKAKLKPRFVVTKFSAEKGKSKSGGVDFTRVGFSLSRPATIDEITQVFKMAPGVEAYAMPPDASDSGDVGSDCAPKY